MPTALARTADGAARPIAALLVDRDDDTRAMYSEFLRSQGLKVDEARDGREALAKAIAHQTDVIVTATRLPGISGLDLCKVLRRDPVTASIAIVFVTGDGADTDIRRALAAGASRVLVKPCLPDRLLLEIKQLLGTEVASVEPTRLPSSMTSKRPERQMPIIDRRTTRRVMLNHVHQRGMTADPKTAPPDLVCPNCYQPLRYVNSYLGGVSERHPEQWDYFECQTGCGTFQYRHRTRKLRQIS
jgi:CheY-like chemotaxis protein